MVSQFCLDLSDLIYLFSLIRIIINQRLQGLVTEGRGATYILLLLLISRAVNDQ